MSYLSELRISYYSSSISMLPKNGCIKMEHWNNQGFKIYTEEKTFSRLLPPTSQIKLAMFLYIFGELHQEASCLCLMELK